MKLEDILNENLSLEDKLKIIKQNSDVNVENLQSLDLETVNKIQNEIDNVLTLANEKKEEIEDKITDIKVSISTFNSNVSSYSSKEECKEAFKSINEKRKEQSKLEKDVSQYENISPIFSNMRRTLSDAIIDIKKMDLSKSIDNSNSIISNLQSKIENSKSKIQSYQEKVEKYTTYSKGWQEALDRLSFNINSAPLTDEEFNLVEKWSSKVFDYNDMIKDLKDEIIKEQNNIEQLENQLEKENDILSKNQKQQQKEEQIDQKNEKEINRFNELSSKDKLSKLELMEMKQIYDYINSNGQVKESEKEEMYDKFITSSLKSKDGHYTVDVDEKKPKPQREPAKISKSKSVIAKGKLATIRFMQSVFNKAKEIKNNISDKIIDINIKRQESKQNSKDEKIEKIQQEREKLESKIEQLKAKKSTYKDLVEEHLDEEDEYKHAM